MKLSEIIKRICLPKKLFSLLLVVFLTATLLPLPRAAAEGPFSMQLNFSGSAVGSIRVMEDAYEGNLYFSLTDLAAALSGTEKCFRFERSVSSTDGVRFYITRGQQAVLGSGAGSAGAEASLSYLNTVRNKLTIDGQEKRYYTFASQDGDLYMSRTDVMLVLNVSILVTSDGLFMRPDPLLMDPVQLEENHYFDMMEAVILADSEGRLLYGYDAWEAKPVASLSKLLSIYVLEEALEQGEIHREDPVYISELAEKLSESGDGMISLKAGSQVPFEELFQAMIIASSNEAALALAEHLSGSEEAFTERMRKCARELGLSSVEIFNCNGLPSYSENPLPIKRQNRMSAADLYKLILVLLERYPEILDISSVKLAHFPSLNDYWTANSNPLLFNMEEVNGLKTGNTNRAGYCLAATADQDGKQLIAIVLGAETAAVRGQAAELLLRWGLGA